MTSNNLFIDINNFDTEYMIFEKPLSFYKINYNMGIYYKSENDDSDRKIIFETPKMRCPFQVKEFVNSNNKKYYKLSLSFTTLTNLYNEKEIKKFFFMMKKIDKHIESTVETNKKKWKLPKTLEYKPILKQLDDNFPYFMNVNLPYDEKNGFLFHVYDEKGSKSKLEIIEKQCILSAVLELTDIKFTGTFYRANWSVLQLRKFKYYSPIQEYFMSGCFLIDRDDPEDMIYDNMISNYSNKVSKNIPLSLPSAQHVQRPISIQSPFEVALMPMMQMMMNTFNNNSGNNLIQHRGGPPPPPPPMPKPQTSFLPPSTEELQAKMKSLKAVPTSEIKVSTCLIGSVVDTPTENKSSKSNKSKK